MDRQSVAYLILFVLVAALAAWLAYLWYHGHERSYRRRVAREDQAHEKAMAAKARQSGRL